MRRLVCTVSVLLLSINFSCLITNNSQEDRPLQNNKEEDVKIIKHLFVKAENGLNYRDAPKGKMIDKFLYNKELDVVENTKIYEDIYDEGKLVKGQWVGVLKDRDTVYVFDAYLTHWKDVSDIKDENDFYITLENLNNGRVKEFKNDTTVIKEISLKEFATVKYLQRDDFEVSYNQNLKSKKMDSISKKNHTLVFNCNNGITKTIEDKSIEDDEASEIYNYSTTFYDIKSHLIIKSGWEWTNYFLVNYETCQTIKLNGFPIFNSDYSKMVCIDNDLGDQSIFINAYDGHTIKVKYALDMPILPNRAVFNNKSLLLESYSEWNDGQQHKFSKQYFELIFK